MTAPVHLCAGRLCTLPGGVQGRLRQHLGRRVTFDLPDGGQGAGEAVDVDEEGRLVVRTDSGEEHVFTGEVSVHGIYGAV